MYHESCMLNLMVKENLLILINKIATFLYCFYLLLQAVYNKMPGV